MDGVSGGGVGAVLGCQNLEGRLRLAVLKMNGKGVLALLQGVQVAVFQGNDGTAGLGGVGGIRQTLAVHGHAHELAELPAGGEAQGFAALLVPLALGTGGDGIGRGLLRLGNGELHPDGAGVAASVSGGDNGVGGARLAVIFVGQLVIRTCGQNLALHGDGDLGLHGLAGVDKLGFFQLHAVLGDGQRLGGLGRFRRFRRFRRFGRLAGFRGLGHDGEGNLHLAGVAGGFDAGDGGLSLTDLGIVGEAEEVVLLQSQQSALHPDGDVGLNGTAGVLVLGVFQGDVLLGEGNGFLGLVFLGLDGQGSGRHQAQRQQRSCRAPNQGCAHSKGSSLCF